eukprot:TRINITY_DN29258_c0_g1_i1.p1 TRINITY_DN29258_c0_g1~~TRINITY_DN29258_c0_g1_i1.p1  ORF type:complete len:303 (+),score=42.05 TRINITY_DN29258_c0_g1_i1:63-971(+)
MSDGDDLNGSTEVSQEQSHVSLVHVASYTQSQCGEHSSWTHDGAEVSRVVAMWDLRQLVLKRANRAEASGDAAAGTTIATLAWEDVSAIWISLRTRRDKGFHIELTFETRKGALNFLSIRCRSGGASGLLLEFLQDTKADLLKEEQLPHGPFGAWASVFYRRGYSSNRVRVVLEWTRTIVRLAFALSFLTHLNSLFLSRGNKLIDAMVASFEDLTHFEGFTAFIMLMQHLGLFLFTLHSLSSTVVATKRSFQTFHHAGKKAHKTFTKIRRGSNDDAVNAQPVDVASDICPPGTDADGVRKRN